MQTEEVIRALEAERAACRRQVHVSATEVQRVDGATGLYRVRFAARRDAPMHLVTEGCQVRGDGAWQGQIIQLDASQDTYFRSKAILDLRAKEDGSKETLWVETIGGELAAPVEGRMRISPFDFIEAVTNVYQAPHLRDRLEGLLLLARGNVGTEKAPPAGAAGRAWGSQLGIVWGPPGTGKTHTLGERCAEVLTQNPGHRILLLAPTNDAADKLAVAIAERLGDPRNEPSRVMRVGAGADQRRLTRAPWVLHGSDTAVRAEIAEVERKLLGTNDADEGAQLRQTLQHLRSRLTDFGHDAFYGDEAPPCIVTTTYKAIGVLSGARSSASVAAFDTVVIDEAGLVPVAVAAAVGLLARDRVILAGDPKQLRPIVRGSGVREDTARYLAESGLGHLDIAAGQDAPRNTDFLDVQRRMHEDIAAVISAYQYGRRLRNAAEVQQELAAPLEGWGDLPRGLWYVLDDSAGAASTGAKRDRTSWTRPLTETVIDLLFKHLPALRDAASGLFITPFAAQARRISAWLNVHNYHNWTSSTVHRQQGQQADFVIFDTVRASCRAWSRPDWERLVNVSLSRARRGAVVLAGRDEMAQPFLRALLDCGLLPCAIQDGALRRASLPQPHLTHEHHEPRPHTIGAYLKGRRDEHVLPSAQQDQLLGLNVLDGGPRLLRGVAGSGKTKVLARWAARLQQRNAADPSRGPIWFVYRNERLKHLLERTTEEQWTALHAPDSAPPFPTTGFLFRHVLEVLDGFNTPVKEDRDVKNVQKRAQAILDEPHFEKNLAGRSGRPRTILVDEAQDLGVAGLRLLARIAVPDADGRRNVLIAYDDGQNLYGAKRPKFEGDVGLDIQGRSAILRESYRTTRQILEFATNVLSDGIPSDPGLADLCRGKLLVQDGNWLKVPDASAVHQDGAAPTGRIFENEDDARNAAIGLIELLVRDHDVSPARIGVVTMGTGPCSIDEFVRHLNRDRPGPAQALKIEAVGGEGGQMAGNHVYVDTPHSFKGHERDIIVIPALNRLWAAGDGLARDELQPRSFRNAYVAFTRARELLFVFGTEQTWGQTLVTITRKVATRQRDRDDAGCGLLYDGMLPDEPPPLDIPGAPPPPGAGGAEENCTVEFRRSDARGNDCVMLKANPRGGAQPREISLQSELGKALDGCETGDELTAHLDGHRVTIRVLAVWPPMRGAAPSDGRRDGVEAVNSGASR